MHLWEAALLGVVQGLTEFLPISSTAHLLVARQALGHEHPEDAFTTVIQLGTLVAVLWYFRTDIAVLVRAVVVGDWKARKLASTPESRMAWLIVLGTVPAVVVGGLGKDWLKATFYNLTAMAWVAIVFALVPNVPVAGAALLLTGVSNAGFSVMQATLIYLAAPAEMRSRLYGVLSVCIGSAPIGFLALGVLADLIGASLAIALSGAVGLCALVASWPWWRRLGESGIT